MNQLLNPLRTSFVSFWDARNPRERSVLLIAGALVLLLMIWLWLIDPALQGRAQLKKTLPAMQTQLAQLQMLTKKAAALTALSASEATATSSAPLSRSLLESSLVRKGLKPETLEVNGEFVRLKLSGASFAALIGWLTDMQVNAQLAVNEANVVALEQGGRVDASLSLRQQR